MTRVVPENRQWLDDHLLEMRTERETERTQHVERIGAYEEAIDKERDRILELDREIEAIDERLGR